MNRSDQLSQHPKLPRSRHMMERLLAPYLRRDLNAIHQTVLDLVERVEEVELSVQTLKATVEDIDAHIPAVLNAISSTNGTARLLRREIDVVADGLAATQKLVQPNPSD